VDWKRVIELGTLAASLVLASMSGASRSPSPLIPVPPPSQRRPEQPPSPPPHPPPPHKPMGVPKAIEVPYNDHLASISVSIDVPWSRLPKKCFVVVRKVGVFKAKGLYSHTSIVGRVCPGQDRVRDSFTLATGEAGSYLNYCIQLWRDDPQLGHLRITIYAVSIPIVPRVVRGGAKIVGHEYNFGLRGGYLPMISGVMKVGRGIIVSFDLSNAARLATANKFNYFYLLYDGKRVWRKAYPSLPPVYTLPLPSGRHVIEVMAGKAMETGLYWVETLEVEA